MLCYYYFKAQRRERLLELQEKISIIEELDNTLQSKEDSLAQMQSILDSKDIIIDNLKKEITLKKNEILSKELEISNRDIEITSKEIEISTKVQEISNKDRELSNKDRELSNKDRELSNKDLEISSKDEEISSLGRKFQDIYAEHFEILNRLVAEYRNKKNRPEKVKLAFFADMEKEFQKLQSPIHIADLEKLLETYHGHIVTKLKEAIPDIKKADYIFLLHLFAGFAPKSICLICDITIGNFYNKKKRWKEKLAALDSPHKDEFILLIS